jgi:hypothetical protein
LRQLNDLIGQIFLVVFCFVMGAVPLSVLVLGIINFIKATTRRGTIVLQALASLLIWIFLTYAVVLIFFMIVFEVPPRQTDVQELKTTGWFLLGGFIYTLAGAALVYWTKVQARLSRTVPSSYGRGLG